MAAQPGSVLIWQEDCGNRRLLYASLCKGWCAWRDAPDALSESRTGFHHPAQGCEERATLGARRSNSSTL